MADGADFLNGDDLEAILDSLEADKEMEEEFINEVENVSTRNTLITIILEKESGKWHGNQNIWIRTFIKINNPN